MPVKKSTPKSARISKVNSTVSLPKFESEVLTLQSLRLIAAPDPKDDLTDDELAEICSGSQYSSELIKHLIDCIKSI
jgi:hypothetical protein